MVSHFSHEKLIVYQRAIEFVAWSSSILDEIEKPVAAKDQLNRSSESIPVNIAEGNAKWSPRERCAFLDTAYGSALESAACLDVFCAKGLLSHEKSNEGKDRLCEIVSMLISLRKVTSDRIMEDQAGYGARPSTNQGCYFDHEKLKVYQRTLGFISWGESLQDADGGKRIVGLIDRPSTSMALNVAEGNGKYSVLDRCRFLDIAGTAALKCASCLDVIVARKKLRKEEIEPGKELLREVVSMLIGLRKRFSEERQKRKLDEE